MTLDTLGVEHSSSKIGNHWEDYQGIPGIMLRASPDRIPPQRGSLATVARSPEDLGTISGLELQSD